jgi:hypothetical protein
MTLTSPSPLPADTVLDAPAAPVPQAPASGPVRFERSLVDRACLGDAEALQLILRQFIDPLERIESCEYLGTLGIQPFGVKSFVVLTPRRVGSLRIGWFGQVIYQDAPLEYTVSGLIAQPSRLWLYLLAAFSTLVVLSGALSLFVVLGAFSFWGIVALLVMPLMLAFTWLVTVRVYYALNKCGILWAVREGLWVYAFTNRGRMNIANRLHRRIFELRERRVRDVQAVN